MRITGKAVYSMTQMFLQMWNAFALEKDKLDYEKFCLEDVRPLAKEERGIVLPYSDHPLDSEFVGESVYINLINSAQKYIYFFTPYLIIDNEVVTALILAAKRGVDVRIITPGIRTKDDISGNAVLLSTACRGRCTDIPVPARICSCKVCGMR